MREKGTLFQHNSRFPRVNYGMLTLYVSYYYAQNDSKDPSKTLEWYKRSLGTKLSNEQLFACLTQFYNELDRNGVRY